ncbi:M48 family metallopeptidase [Brevibacillus centrosporus]|uniref:M48 family metallopeptidase n=1 Tax=Brevibacillus centrosporus TaxID=54910 RepID=UPI003B0194B3
MRFSYGQALFKELQEHPENLTKKGLSEKAASVYSLVIIGSSIAGFLFSVYGLISWYQSPFILIGCVLILLVAWLSRPRPNRLPKKVMTLNSAQHPNTMKMLETIKEKMGIEKDIHFALSPHYEAYTTEYGWNRRRIVVIGYPLLFAYAPGELTALIAHELAHCCNNDVRRSLLVAHAHRILLNWCDLLDPIRDDDEYYFSFVTTISRGIMRILFWIPYRLLFILTQLFWNQSQRAEYEADRMAVKLAGTQNLISMLQIAHMGDVVDSLIGRHAIQKQSMTLGEQLREIFAKLPMKEKARVQKVLERSQGSMDTTHPATHLRIAMVQGKEVAPAFQISEEEYNRVHQEILEQVQEKMEHRILDEYRAKIS